MSIELLARIKIDLWKVGKELRNNIVPDDILRKVVQRLINKSASWSPETIAYYCKLSTITKRQSSSRAASYESETFGSLRFSENKT